jgi:SAM-dependent methyltransferase
MSENDQLRETFNAAALEYEAIRPGYPSELIDDVIALSAIPQNGQALEIGCGTGQATLPFALRGYQITCLDIGPNLLAIAREKLSRFPKVSFRNISFEKWPAKLGAFDLIYSATAFHWIPREIGLSKAALALKPGGALAVFSNEHPRPYSGFFDEVQTVYQRLVPEWEDPAVRPSTEVEIRSKQEYIWSTGLFSSVTVRTYPWTKTYTTSEHIRLLNTYSDHLRLEENRRLSLYQSIADLIESRYAGQVEKPYLAVLYLGKK